MNAVAHGHTVRYRGPRRHMTHPRADGAGALQAPCAGREQPRPVGFASLSRTVRRACSVVGVRALTSAAGDLARRGALARVYAHFFPEEWQGEVESGGESLLHGAQVACGVALRLLRHIARTDLLPLEEWALDDLEMAMGDTDAEAPHALSSIPLYPTFGFDWEQCDNGDEQASAGLLVLMAILISDSGVGLLLEEMLRVEAEQEAESCGAGEESSAARAARRWEHAQVVLERVTTTDQVAALCTGAGAAFARLGEPWASVPLLASYLVADTPNGYLNLVAETWSGTEEYPWTVENVRLLAAEWMEAKALLTRIDAAMNTLAQPEAVDMLLAALTETFDMHDRAREGGAARAAASTTHA